MENSAQTEILNETISALSEETRDLSKSLAHMQEQYAAMMTWQTQAPPQVPPTGPHAAFATRTPPQPLIPKYVPSPQRRPGYAP